jgi:hypothetical protein
MVRDLCKLNSILLYQNSITPAFKINSLSRNISNKKWAHMDLATTKPLILEIKKLCSFTNLETMIPPLITWQRLIRNTEKKGLALRFHTIIWLTSNRKIINLMNLNLWTIYYQSPTLNFLKTMMNSLNRDRILIFPQIRNMKSLAPTQRMSNL